VEKYRINECSVEVVKKVQSMLKLKLDLMGLSHDMETRRAIIRAGGLNLGSHCGL
jgi:hypothetical protein